MRSFMVSTNTSFYLRNKERFEKYKTYILSDVTSFLSVGIDRIINRESDSNLMVKLSNLGIKNGADLLYYGFDKLDLDLNSEECTTIICRTLFRVFAGTHESFRRTIDGKKIFIREMFEILDDSSNKFLEIPIPFDLIKLKRCSNKLREEKILTYNDLKNLGINGILNLDVFGRTCFYALIDVFVLSYNEFTKNN